MRDAPARVALITGASSGIGQATAVELASRGYEIAIHYKDYEEGARATFERIRILPDGKARVYSADLCDPDQVAQMAGQVLADFERLDVLVNNAGGIIERRPLVEMDLALWRRVFALNIDSVFLVSRAVLPRMIEQRSGVIVNVASIAGRTGGGPGASAYSAAKGGLITLTKSMAKELISFGIRVNAVNPGLIDTPFHAHNTPRDVFEAFVASIPQRRAGRSEEVAKAIAFLASEDSSYLVGECLEVNGGMLFD